MPTVFTKYIDGLSDKERRQLFGVEGAKEYRAGGDWQKLTRGWQGFGKPQGRLEGKDFSPYAGYPLKIRRQVQNKHIKGTREYENYVKEAAKKGYIPSVLAEDVDPQELVNKFSGTGKYDPNPKDGSPRENVDAGKVIGQYHNWSLGVYVDTTWFEIVYSKKGTHIYPIRPNKGRIK